MTAQNGSSVSGTGTIKTQGITDASVFAGTSTATTLDLQISIGPQAITYTGNYVTGDSIAGTVTFLDTLNFHLDLKKQ